MKELYMINLTKLGQKILSRCFEGIKVSELQGFNLILYSVLWQTNPEQIKEAVNDLMVKKLITTKNLDKDTPHYIMMTESYSPFVKLFYN